MKLYLLMGFLMLSLSSIGSIAYSAPANMLSLETITSANLDRLQKVATLQNISATGFSFSPDGSTLVTAGGGLKAWDVKTIINQKGENDEPIWTFDGRLSDVAYSPDGKLIAAGGIEPPIPDGDGETGAIYLLSAQNQRQYALLQGRGGTGDTDIRLLEFNRDGSELAAAEPYAISLWNINNAISSGFLKIDKDAFVIQTDLNEQGYSSHQMMSLDFSPMQSNLLAFATADVTDCSEGGCTYSNERIVLWDTAQNKVIATLKGHSNWISDIEFSPHGDLLASASGEIAGYGKDDKRIYGDDNTVRLWNVQSADIVGFLRHSFPVYNIAFSPDQSLLASLDAEGNLYLWSVATDDQLAAVKVSDQLYSARLAFSPDGKLIAISTHLQNSGISAVQFWGIPASPS